MSDTLTRAKKLVAQHEASGYIHRDATLLLPELIAECEFWRREAIEERAARLFPLWLPLWEDLPEEDYGVDNEGEILHGKKYYREQAERELDMTDHNQQAERELDSEHEHVWVNMAPNIHMTCSICGKTKTGIRGRL